MIPVQDGYQSSFFVVMFVAFTMAFDFMAVFITIYFYWTQVLGGDYRWYGFAFACYDLSQFILTPFLGYWADKRSMKEVLLVTCGVNAMGNVLYALAYKTGPWMLILGRLIAGAGAGNLAITLAYTSKVSTRNQRLTATNWLRLATTLGRFGGPLLGILFVQTWWPTGKVASVELDMFTEPAWTTAGLALLCVILVIFLKEPDNEKNKEEQNFSALFRDSETSRSVLMLNASLLLTVVAYWMWYSQLVPIGVSEFDLVKTYQIGEVYYGVGAGFLAATIFVKKALNILKTKACLLLGILVSMAGLVFFFQFNGHEHVSPMWMLYVGTGACCTGFGTYMTVFRTAYTNKVDSHSYSITLIALLSMTGSMGRFLGPFLAPLITSFSGDETCCSKENSVFDCCHLHGLNIALPVSLVLFSLSAGMYLLYTSKTDATDTFAAEQTEEDVLPLLAERDSVQA